jgi:hypothetical protein
LGAWSNDITLSIYKVIIVPEWVTFLLTAIMWVIGFILIISFVLITIKIFGRHLKKIGFHISIKEGIGFDIETHTPSIPAPNYHNKASRNDKKIGKSDNTTKLDIKTRVKQIIESFNGQKFPGTLFGIDDDWKVQLSRPEKVSLLSQSLTSQINLFAESADNFIDIINKRRPPFNHNYFNRLFVVCLQEIPENQEKWLSALEQDINRLEENSIIWVVASKGFPENKDGDSLRVIISRMKLHERRILTSTLIDIETLEINSGKHWKT